MLINVNPSDPRPIYLQIMDEVRRALVVGTLQPDEPLPSVRQLAAELRVNPNTVQQAYRELEREALVYVLRGRGTFAAAVPGTGDQDGELARELARELAVRVLQEAYRYGLTVEELIEALRQAADGESPPTGSNRETPGRSTAGGDETR